MLSSYRGILILLLCMFFFHVELFAFEFVTVGTGSQTGVYYPAGKAISRIFNRGTRQHGIKALVKSTKGSVYNINAMLEGEFQFALAQSDRQFQAYNGLEEWSVIGARKSIRSVFSIHKESVVLMASVESGIRSVMDLKGKVVNIGNQGSGQLQNSIDILSAFRIPINHVKVRHHKALKALSLFQNREIDAFFYTVGHPNRNIVEASSNRVKANFIPLKGEEIAQLLSQKTYYSKAVVPVSKYYSHVLNPHDVESIGVNAVFITLDHVDENTVYLMTKAVFENLELLKQSHPALSGITPSQMIQGFRVPIHEGAKRYYKEIGLLK